MKKINFKNNKQESFVEMLQRLDTEDHGSMTREEYQELKDKWMGVYTDIKNKEKNPLLMSYEDIQGMYK
jgi:hypothetical protein